MAFFQLVLKANRLKKARQKYYDEKLHSIEISKGIKPKYTFFQKIRHEKILLKRKIKRILKRYFWFPENTWIYKKIVLLKTDGTLENYVLKSIFGFIGGALLTYMFFIFFVFQLHFSLISATFLCSFLGIFLTMSLAFSPYMRCIIFLFLPIFFSKRGRHALMAYAFILTLSGPARNTLHNLGALADSLTCIQQLLKETLKSVIDLIKRPFVALREPITEIVKSIKVIVRRIKQMLIAMKRIVLSILRVIEAAFEWLGSVVSVCNRDFGTPYDRCQKMFEDAVEGCKEKLGDVAGKACSLGNVVGTVCLPLQPINAICNLVNFVSSAIIDEVKQALRKFSREMRAMFYVKIKFSHYYHLETNKSRSLAEISSAISTEIKSRTQTLMGFFSMMGFITSLFFLFLFARVIYYRYKWLTSERFDNYFLTGYMRDIDLIRARQDKETVFPLNWQERSKYISPTSILLARSERIRLAKSALFLTMTCIKIGIYMGVDYCLFWTLDTIRQHGSTRPQEQQRQVYAASVQVKGQGFVADLYRGVGKAFSPYEPNPEADLESISCLPNPRQPNYDRYLEIATLALLCWIMALFEPYGLRLRHLVLSQYYPDRAKQRSVYLYNKILRSRGSFLKYARRQLRRQFGTATNGNIERVTIRERLWAVFPFLNKIAPMKQRKMCLLCGQPERDRSAPHIACPTPGCPGTYCPQCFQDLGKLCTICRSPMDYGDLTDISEEKDSSEEEIDLSGLRARIDAIKAKTEEERTEEERKLLDEEREKLEAIGETVTSDGESSKYSYSYQDDSTEESVLPPQRKSFTDVEAQPVRDDVTMKIFSEFLDDEVTSESEVRVFCFGIGKRKKRKKHLINVEKDKSESTSIADTESWTTEEVEDQDEEVIDIEIEDSDDQKYSDDELLPNVCKERQKCKKKGFKKFMKNISKLFRFSKKKEKKTKNDKDSIHTGEDDTDNSSSTILSTCNENHELLDLQSTKSSAKSELRQRNGKNVKKYESERENNEPWNVKRVELEKYCYAHQIKFETTDLPRYLKSVSKKTRYFEIDESSSGNSPREIIQYRGDFSSATDTKSSVDSDPSRDRPSSTSNADNDSYIYTSENNAEKRYETESHSSESFLSEELQFSDTSTDVIDNKTILCLDNDKASSDQAKLSNDYKEDKINDDSDEKGFNHQKRKIVRKDENFDSVSDEEPYYDSIKIRKRIGRGQTKEKFAKETFQTRKKQSSCDKSDVLKRVKVEKETANEKKRNSLINEKSSDYDNESIVQKIDKSVGVQEADIKRYLENKEGEFIEKRCRQIKLKPTDNAKVTFNEKKENDGNSVEASGLSNHPGKRDQGTYVRLKNKKFKDH